MTCLNNSAINNVNWCTSCPNGSHLARNLNPSYCVCPGEDGLTDYSISKAPNCGTNSCNNGFYLDSVTTSCTGKEIFINPN